MMTFSIQSHHYSDTRLQWLHIIFPEASESDHSLTRHLNQTMKSQAKVQCRESFYLNLNQTKKVTNYSKTKYKREKYQTHQYVTSCCESVLSLNV